MALGILVLAGLLVFCGVLVSSFLRGMRKTESYECGEKPIGTPFTLTPSYMRVMVIFILLEAEVVLLFPWLEVVRWAPREMVLIELGLLTVFLGMVWIYFRKKRLWNWDISSRKQSNSFPTSYERINTFYGSGKKD